MTDNPLKVIQITDLHIFEQADSELLGVNTQKSFEAILELVRVENIHEKIDLILLTGDISQDGSASSYRRVAELLKPFNVPVYVLPGNHDNPDTMLEVYPTANIIDMRRIVFDHWQFILLSSQIVGSVAGYLDQSQLDFMHKCLREYPNRHALISFHHQPVPVGSLWLDKLGIHNADDFWKFAENYPNIKTVLFGHVHQEFSFTHNNITCFSPPSTCIQFKPKQDTFGLDNIPQGFRWVKLYPDGRIETGIRRLPMYIGEFLPDAKGY